MNVCDREIKSEGRLVRIGRLVHEGFEYLDDPEAALLSLRQSRNGIDLFTFLQKLPATSPLYSYPMELDNVAALPVSTFDHWWTRQVDGKTRNMVRRAEKKGVVFREVSLDDTVAKGIWEIYNECPVRQGRPFPHYGKDLETVRKMSATFADCSFFIGGFLGEELIGFIKLTMDHARSQAAVMHILAKVQHRDKAPMNALISQGVQACEKRGIPFIVYSKFAYGNRQRDSLSDFKESNGFQRIDLPRYYVPLSPLGHLALRLRLHHRLIDYIPEPALVKLRDFRNEWNNRKARPVTEAAQKVTIDSPEAKGERVTS